MLFGGCKLHVLHILSMHIYINMFTHLERIIPKDMFVGRAETTEYFLVVFLHELTTQDDGYVRAWSPDKGMSKQLWQLNCHRPTEIVQGFSTWVNEVLVSKMKKITTR